MALLRLLHIAWVLSTLFLLSALARLRLLRTPEAPAERFCRALTRLGGTFVKLGQMLGIRRDLLPDAYAAALGSLQDRVPPFAGHEARAIIEQELGPIESHFARVDDAPLAAASLAQVHRAQLLDGREVVVKVQRPGVRDNVARDIRLLSLALRLVLLVVPRLQRYRPQELLRELEYNLKRELDFRVEAHNTIRFAEAFAHLDTVHVPPVVDELYTERVLVTELSGGCRVDDPGVADGPRLARNFVEAYQYQFFVMGFFHGDPHPGNLFIRPDGRICFHDFGLVGYLDRETRRNLAAFIQALVHKDGEWLVDAYLDLGMLTGRVDRDALRRGLEEILKVYSALPLAQWSFAQAFLDVVRIGRVQNIRLPHNLLVFMRASFLMESTVRALDPNFNLVEDLVSRTEEILKALREGEESGTADRALFELGALKEEMPAALARLARGMREEGPMLPLRVHRLEEVGARLEHAMNRLVVGWLAGVLFVAASLLMQHSIGPRLGGIPVLSLIGYVWAVWLSIRLLRAVGRSGGT